MRRLEPAVGDGDDGKQPVGVALAAEKPMKNPRKDEGEGSLMKRSKASPEPAELKPSLALCSIRLS